MKVKSEITNTARILEEGVCETGILSPSGSPPGLQSVDSGSGSFVKVRTSAWWPDRPRWRKPLPHRCQLPLPLYRQRSWQQEVLPTSCVGRTSLGGVAPERKEGARVWAAFQTPSPAGPPLPGHMCTWEAGCVLVSPLEINRPRWRTWPVLFWLSWEWNKKQKPCLQPFWNCVCCWKFPFLQEC